MAANATMRKPTAEVNLVASRLANMASLEIGAQEIGALEAAKEHLRRGQRIYVSHLPGQSWQSTMEACARVAAVGCEPVPHIPVRVLRDANELRGVLGAARDVGVHEPLLISGDYAKPRGDFSSVLQALQSGALRDCGMARVSLAGHPEGHPQVPWDVICEAQLDKWRFASAGGLAVTFVTQFFFAAGPLVNWARQLRATGVEATLVAGIAGPTNLGALIKLAARCGVGNSARVLTSRPAAMVKLLSDHDPDELLRDLALEKLRQSSLFDGLHLFSLGGFARTAAWLHRNSSRSGA